MRLRKLSIAVFCLLLLVSLAAFPSLQVAVAEMVKPTGVSLDLKSTVSLNIDKTLSLTATVKPETAKSALTWKTSNKKIATVSKSGVVMPKKEGTVTITVITENKKKASVKVRVIDPYKPTGVSLDKKSTVTLNIDESLSLAATLKPATAKSALTWKTSNKKIATVSKGGVVTPKKEGTVTITVTTANKKKASVKVKVVDPYKPTGISLDKKGTVTLDIDKTLIINATLKPATAKSALTWKTSNKKIATVSKGGVVTPKKEGTVTITATTANKKKASVKVKVVDPYKPTGISLGKSGTVGLLTQEKLALSATLKPSTAKSDIKWTTSSKKIATVSSDGVVTGKAKGTATITATTAKNGKKAKVKVKVTNPTMPASVALDRSGTIDLRLGAALSAKATLSPGGAKSNMLWSSSDAKIASVSATGVVTAHADGTATITAKTERAGKTASFVVRVVGGMPCGVATHHSEDGKSHARTACGHYECDGKNHEALPCGHKACDASKDHGASVCGTKGHYKCDGKGHGSLACGHKVCDTGKDHAAADCGAKGHYKCDGKNHGTLPCGHKACDASKQHAVAECETKGHYSCDAKNHKTLACGHRACDTSKDHTTADCGAKGHVKCDGKNHGLLSCGHRACDTSKDHAAAECGTKGHYKCDGKNHGSLSCGHRACNTAPNHSAAACNTKGHHLCDGKDHKTLTCGHNACDTSKVHETAACKTKNHYQCDGVSHNPLPCGHDACNTAQNHGAAACETKNHHQCDGTSHNTLPCGHNACDKTEEHGAADCEAQGHYRCDALDHGAAGCEKKGHNKCDENDHADAGCGIDGHLLCDGNDHAVPPCGYAGHYLCDGKDHVVSECGYGHHYGCDERSHAKAGCLNPDHTDCDGLRHAEAPCGAKGHYLCDGDDHAAAPCGAEKHANCDGESHAGAECGIADHRDCDGLAHAPATCGDESHHQCDEENHGAVECGAKGHTHCDGEDHAEADCGIDGHRRCDGRAHTAAPCEREDHYACDGENHAVPDCKREGHHACDEENHTSAACGIENHYRCDGASHTIAECGTDDHFTCDEQDHSAASCGLTDHLACDGRDHAECDTARAYTVRYIDERGRMIAANAEGRAEIGHTISTAEFAMQIKGFTYLRASRGELVISEDERENEIVLTYARLIPYDIRHYAYAEDEFGAVRRELIFSEQIWLRAGEPVLAEDHLTGQNGRMRMASAQASSGGWYSYPYVGTAGAYADSERDGNEMEIYYFDQNAYLLPYTVRYLDSENEPIDAEKTGRLPFDFTVWARDEIGIFLSTHPEYHFVSASSESITVGRAAESILTLHFVRADEAAAVAYTVRHESLEGELLKEEVRYTAAGETVDGYGLKGQLFGYRYSHAEPGGFAAGANEEENILTLLYHPMRYVTAVYSDAVSGEEIAGREEWYLAVGEVFTARAADIKAVEGYDYLYASRLIVPVTGDDGENLVYFCYRANEEVLPMVTIEHYDENSALLETQFTYAAAGAELSAPAFVQERARIYGEGPFYERLALSRAEPELLTVSNDGTRNVLRLYYAPAPREVELEVEIYLVDEQTTDEYHIGTASLTAMSGSVMVGERAAELLSAQDAAPSDGLIRTEPEEIVLSAAKRNEMKLYYAVPSGPIPIEVRFEIWMRGENGETVRLESFAGACRAVSGSELDIEYYARRFARTENIPWGSYIGSEPGGLTVDRVNNPTVQLIFDASERATAFELWLSQDGEEFLYDQKSLTGWLVGSAYGEDWMRGVARELFAVEDDAFLSAQPDLFRPSEHAGIKLVYDAAGIAVEEGVELVVVRHEDDNGDVIFPAEYRFASIGDQPALDQLAVEDERYTAVALIPAEFSVSGDRAQNTVTVRYALPDENEYAYTIRYLDESGRPILEETADSAVNGTVIDATELIPELDASQYRFVSVEPRELTIGSDEAANVIEILFEHLYPVRVYALLYDEEGNADYRAEDDRTIYASHRDVVQYEEVVAYYDYAGYTLFDAEPRALRLVPGGDNFIQLSYAIDGAPLYGYIVRYVDLDGTVLATRTARAMENWYVEASGWIDRAPEELDGYIFVGTGDNGWGLHIEQDEATNILTLKYSNGTEADSYPVSVRFVDENGLDIAEPLTAYAHIGDKLNEWHFYRPIPGYKIKSNEPENIIIGDGENRLDIAYEQLGHYTVRYVDLSSGTALRGDILAASVVGQGLEIQYEHAKSFDGYEFIYPSKRFLTVDADALKNVVTLYYAPVGAERQTIRVVWLDENGEAFGEEEFAIPAGAVVGPEAVTVDHQRRIEEFHDDYYYDLLTLDYAEPASLTVGEGENILYLHYKVIPYPVGLWIEVCVMTDGEPYVYKTLWETAMSESVHTADQLRALVEKQVSLGGYRGASANSIELTNRGENRIALYFDPPDYPVWVPYTVEMYMKEGEDESLFTEYTDEGLTGSEIPVEKALADLDEWSDHYRVSSADLLEMPEPVVLTFMGENRVRLYFAPPKEEMEFVAHVWFERAGEGIHYNYYPFTAMTGEALDIDALAEEIAEFYEIDAAYIGSDPLTMIPSRARDNVLKLYYEEPDWPTDYTLELWLDDGEGEPYLFASETRPGTAGDVLTLVDLFDIVEPAYGLDRAYYKEDSIGGEMVLRLRSENKVKMTYHEPESMNMHLTLDYWFVGENGYESLYASFTESVQSGAEIDLIPFLEEFEAQFGFDASMRVIESPSSIVRTPRDTTPVRVEYNLSPGQEAPLTLYAYVETENGPVLYKQHEVSYPYGATVTVNDAAQILQNACGLPADRLIPWSTPEWISVEMVYHNMYSLYYERIEGLPVDVTVEVYDHDVFVERFTYPSHDGALLMLAEVTAWMENNTDMAVKYLVDGSPDGGLTVALGGNQAISLYYAVQRPVSYTVNLYLEEEWGDAVLLKSDVRVGMTGEEPDIEAIRRALEKDYSLSEGLRKPYTGLTVLGKEFDQNTIDLYYRMPASIPVQYTIEARVDDGGEETYLYATYWGGGVSNEPVSLSVVLDYFEMACGLSKEWLKTPAPLTITPTPGGENVFELTYVENMNMQLPCAIDLVWEDETGDTNVLDSYTYYGMIGEEVDIQSLKMENELEYGLTGDWLTISPESLVLNPRDADRRIVITYAEPESANLKYEVELYYQPENGEMYRFDNIQFRAEVGAQMTMSEIAEQVENELGIALEPIGLSPDPYIVGPKNRTVKLICAEPEQLPYKVNIWLVGEEITALYYTEQFIGPATGAIDIAELTAEVECYVEVAADTLLPPYEQHYELRPGEREIDLYYGMQSVSVEYAVYVILHDDEGNALEYGRMDQRGRSGEEYDEQALIRAVEAAWPELAGDYSWMDAYSPGPRAWGVNAVWLHYAQAQQPKEEYQVELYLMENGEEPYLYRSYTFDMPETGVVTAQEALEKTEYAHWGLKNSEPAFLSAGEGGERVLRLYIDLPDDFRKMVTYEVYYLEEDGKKTYSETATDYAKVGTVITAAEARQYVMNHSGVSVLLYDSADAQEWTISLRGDNVIKLTYRREAANPDERALLIRYVDEAYKPLRPAREWVVEVGAIIGEEDLAQAIEGYRVSFMSVDLPLTVYADGVITIVYEAVPHTTGEGGEVDG